jgi:O-antigen/teichoic acid export membrane protein
MNLNRRYVLYMPILAGASGLLFLRTFLYARVFPVEGFGALNQALLVASTFTNLAGIGLLQLAQKLLPQFHALEEREKFEDLLSSCVVMCALSAVAATGVLAIAVAMGWLQGLLLFAIALQFAVAQYLFSVRLIEIKSELRFLYHSRVSALRAVALLAVGVSVATLTGSVSATLAAEAMVTLTIAWPLVAGERGKTVIAKLRNFKSDHRWFSQYSAPAMRLFLLNGALTALYAIDRWFGIALLTKHEYGIFALGLTIISLFETLQLIVNVSAYPLMGRMIARGEQARAFRFASVASIVILAAGALCYIPFVLLLDFLLARYLPSYLEAANVIRLAVIVGVLRLADFYGSFAILLNYERRLTAGSAGLLAAAVLAMVLVNVTGIARFDPDRMIQVSVAVAAGVFVLNFAIAVRAFARARRATASDSA